MKFYWKMTFGCATLMLLLLAMPFSPWWCATGVAVCLLSGYAGVKLMPYVPALRHKKVALAVCLLATGGFLQGIGLFSRQPLVWGLGLTLNLAIPLAGLAYDIQEDEAFLRKLLA